MGKYQPIYKYTFLLFWGSLAIGFIIAIIGPLANKSTIQDQLASSYEIEFSQEISLASICDWVSQTKLPDEGVVTAQYKGKTQNIVSYSFGECGQLTKEMKLYYGDDISLSDIQAKKIIIVFFNNEDVKFPQNSPLRDSIKTKKLTIAEAKEIFLASKSPLDIIYKDVQEYRLYVFSSDGIPFKLSSTGHSWLVLVAMIDNKPQIVGTYTSWPGKDDDGSNNASKGQYFNVATRNSLFVDIKDDLKTSKEYFDGTDTESINQTYTVFSQQQVKDFILLREWFLPRFARPDKYQTYLWSKFLYGDTARDRIDGGWNFLTAGAESAITEVFWFVLRSTINGGRGSDFAYDGVVSNCTAYVATLWNNQDAENFRYKLAFLIPAPSILYRDIGRYINK